MPILKRFIEAFPISEPLPDNTPINKPMSTWTVVAIVAGSLVLLSICLMSISICIRQSQDRGAEPQGPYLIYEDARRKRKMSEVDRMELEEMQRTDMIRKSLASRSSSSIKERNDEERGDMGDLPKLQADNEAETWKEREARAQSDRNLAELPTYAELAIPAQSRSRSASRSPLPGAQRDSSRPSTPSFQPLPSPLSAAQSPKQPRPASPQPALVL